MKNCDKQNLIISIENSIDFIESHLDSADKNIAFVTYRLTNYLNIVKIITN